MYAEILPRLAAQMAWLSLRQPSKMDRLASVFIGLSTTLDWVLHRIIFYGTQLWVVRSLVLKSKKNRPPNALNMDYDRFAFRKLEGNRSSNETEMKFSGQMFREPKTENHVHDHFFDLSWNRFAALG